MTQPAERLAAQLEQNLAPMLAENGYQLMELEYRQIDGRWTLRLFCDKAGGLSLDDCHAISRKVSEWLDLEDPIPQEYVLEVSSPGLFRALKKPKHFQQSVGKTIRLRLSQGELPDRKKRELRGQLLKATEQEIELALPDEGPVLLPYGALHWAKLDPDL